MKTIAFCFFVLKQKRYFFLWKMNQFVIGNGYNVVLEVVFMNLFLCNLNEIL